MAKDLMNPLKDYGILLFVPTPCTNKSYHTTIVELNCVDVITNIYLEQNERLIVSKSNYKGHKEIKSIMLDKF